MNRYLTGTAVLLTAVLLSARPAMSQPVRQLTLQEAIALALEKNPTFQIAKADVEKSESQIREAYGLAMPTIEGSLQYTRNLKKPVFFLPDFNNPNSGKVTPIEIGSNNSYTASLSLTQALFSKTVGTALEVAEVYQDYTTEGVSASRSQTILDVKKAYYGLLLARRMQTVIGKVFQLTEANYQNVKAMYEQGLASEFDQLRMSVQLANMKPSVVQADNGVRLAELNLKNTIGILETPVPVDDFDFAVLPDDQIQRGETAAVQMNPTIRQLQHQKSLLEKNKEIKEAGYWPSLYGFGTWQTQTQSEDFKFGSYTWVESAYIGLNLSIPIFSGFQTTAQVEQADLEVRKMDLTISQVQKTITLGVRNAALKMSEARERVEAQQAAIGQAEKALSIAEIRFKSGVGMQLEVLDAQVALSQTLTNHAQAVYDYLVARADWEQLVGTGK